MDINKERKIAEDCLKKIESRLSLFNQGCEQYYKGIALAAIAMRLKDNQLKNPFPEDTVEFEVFRVGVLSVDDDITVPDQSELKWVCESIIKKAFKPLIDGELNVVRQSDDLLVFISDGTGIERIYALCEKTYTLKMSKSISNTNSKIATLTINL